VTDPEVTERVERTRKAVVAFLDERLPADWAGLGALDADEVRAFTLAWREQLAERGWLAPSWPVELGGAGLSAVEQVVVHEELHRRGVPTGRQNDAFSIQMLGNTLLRFGTDEQQRRLLPRLLAGEDVWCQGYSEPGAGSDLASLGCRAVLDGDEWVIDGQKVWTSCAHEANWIFLLARTDPDAPKHRGISFLLVPMDQPGVEVRRIRMLTGESEFNEVFFTGARCPASNVVGGVDQGWAVAMALLGYERGEAAVVYPMMFREELDRLRALIRSRGRGDDPVIRDRVARLHSRVEVMRMMGLRTLTDFAAGRAPGPEAAVFKLFWSEYHQDLTALAIDVLGADALVPSGRWPTTATPTDDVGAPNDSASWVGTFLNSRSGTIYAGTSEIQRNILAEMVLGLPRHVVAPAGA